MAHLYNIVNLVIDIVLCSFTGKSNREGHGCQFLAQMGMANPRPKRRSNRATPAALLYCSIITIPVLGNNSLAISRRKSASLREPVDPPSPFSSTKQLATFLLQDLKVKQTNQIT